MLLKKNLPDLPGLSRSAAAMTTSLGGANLDAADINDPCFLLAPSVLGLALSECNWDNS